MDCNPWLWLPTNEMLSNHAVHFSLYGYLNILAGDLIPLIVTFFFIQKHYTFPEEKLNSTN